MVYGYVRVSTKSQSVARQIDNIKSECADAVIIQEKYTGTTIDRPEFQKLLKTVKEGDTIIFDEVSRFSRNAKSGFEIYEDLFNRGVDIVFIKQRLLNTENFRKVVQLELTGKWLVDEYVIVTNRVLMRLAKEQIETAFKAAEDEVVFLHQRTVEGMAVAKMNGKQIGLKKGTKLVTKKSKEMKKQIVRYSKDFNGTLSDKDVMAIIKISRNTYYKYKNELKHQLWYD